MRKAGSDKDDDDPKKSSFWYIQTQWCANCVMCVCAVEFELWTCGDSFIAKCTASTHY